MLTFANSLSGLFDHDNNYTDPSIAIGIEHYFIILEILIFLILKTSN